MFCSNCGKEIDATVSFCPNCGTAVNKTNQTVYEGEFYSEPYQNQTVKPGVDGFAIASLVLGIISFFILPIIGSILAIILGNKSINDNGDNTMAKVGKILGIVSLILSIVGVIIVILALTIFGLSAFAFMEYLL